MATYQDFDGVYFTLQSLRLYQDLDDTELLVVDNYGCEHTKKLVETWIKGRYILAADPTGTAAPRDLVFREASGEAVLCCDSHVQFAPNAIGRLKAFYREHPECTDLLQGPLVYDDLENIATHFDPVWRGQMWGIWATDPRGRDAEAEPFEIPMQGLGAFSCRKSAWLGFNPRFRGFGGEEGYIHEKFRQAGCRTLCLPWLRWTHRFSRTGSVPYPLYVEDKLRNYLIGHAELGLDLRPIIAHFSEFLSADTITAVMSDALQITLVAPARTASRVHGESTDFPQPTGDTQPASAELAASAAQRSPAEQQAGARTITLATEPRVLTPGRHYPPVSCICLTYGRPELLEEAIQSFLLQEYPGEKELIVLNDFDQQRLVFEHPDVHVLNLPRRFRTVGEKANAAVALAAHDLLFVWDDDDVYLPNRLTFSVERFDPQKGFFKPARAWFWNDGQLGGPEANVFHSGSCWSRDLFSSVRGYAAMDNGYDQDIEARFAAARPGSTVPYDIRPEEISYLYRWGGTRSYHVSGFARGDYHRAVADFVSEQVRLGQLGTGPIVLAPRWRTDYAALVREYLTNFIVAAGRATQAPILASSPEH
jgi:glycosyltransferase involved in cell wall biosynthesis